MRDRRTLALVGVLALILMAATGCVSSKMYKSDLEDTDSRVTAVENAVESNEKKIDNLEQETDRRLKSTEKKADDAAAMGQRALGTAQSAEQKAAGKLLWTVTITNDEVKFPFGSAKLEPAAISKIDAMVSKIKGYGKALYLEVEGHTDSVGDEHYNKRLAGMRADAVRDYLHEKGGIPLHAMNTLAVGEEDPVADNSTREGRAQNRRVVIRVLE
jgi:outer membrane protein OmpA-like peptidoglycan-associated protein